MREKKNQILKDELQHQKKQNEQLYQQILELRNEINNNIYKVNQAEEILKKYNDELLILYQLKKDYELLISKVKLEYRKFRRDSIQSKLEFFKKYYYRKE